MKTNRHTSIVSLLGALAMAGLIAGCSEKTKEDAKATAEKAKDTTKDLVADGKVMASNAAPYVKAGWDKAGDVTTNVVAKVKEGAEIAGDALTNAVGKVKDKVNGTNQ